MSATVPSDIIVFVGDSPEQVVVRALAACVCNEPEGHAALAPQMLARVQPNEGEPSWPFALVLPYDGGGWNLHAEGVRVYRLGDEA